MLPEDAELAGPTPLSVESRPARRRYLRWLGALALLIVVVLGALTIGLNSQWGRNLIIRQISQTTFSNGLRISVGRVEGSLFGAAKLHDVRAYDTKGEFLRVPLLELDWRPLAYARNHIDVRLAHAPDAVLERVPQFKVSTTNGPLLPDLDIDIARLQVDRLVTEPAVSGERRLLQLDGSGHIASGRAQIALKAGTLAGADRLGGDRIDLKLDAVPAANKLALNLQLDAPAGGVLAALGGWKDGLSARVDGTGDWQHWAGKVDADLAGAPLARLLVDSRSGTLSVKGTAALAKVLSGMPAELAGPVTQIDLTAKLAGRSADVTGTMASDALRAGYAGKVDFAANRFGNLVLDWALLRPAALAPNLAARALHGKLTLDGAFGTPDARYELSAAALAFNSVVIEGLQASGAARVNPDHLLIPVKAFARRINGLDQAVGGALVNVRLDGDLAVAGTRILSDNMRIRSDRIDAKAVLIADFSRGFYAGAFNGRIANYRIESVGTFAVDTRVDLKQVGSGYGLTGSVRARSQRLDNANVRDFLGGNATGSSNIAYGSDGIIRFSQLRVVAPQLRITDGRGTYAPGGKLAITLTGQSAKYGPLAVELTGTLTNPKAVVLARNPGFGIGLTNVRAQIFGTSGNYRFAATGTTDYGPLTAEVTMLQGKGPVTLQIDRGDLAGIGFAGRLQRSTAGPYIGQLDANGRGLVGVVRLGAVGRYQQALINFRANNTVLPGPAQLSIGSAIVDAKVVLYDTPYVVADVQLAQTSMRGLNLAVARGLIDYRGGRGQAKFLAEGISGVPFRIAGNAALEPQLWRVALDGRVRGIAFKTASPARIVPSARGYELLPSRLDFGRGNMRLSGTYGQGLSVQSRLDSMDLSLINSIFPGYGLGGQATGSLDFAQTSPAAFPQLKTSLAISSFTRTTAVSVSQPIDLNLIGTLGGSGGNMNAVMRRRGSVIGRIAATFGPPGGGGTWTQRLSGAALGGGIRYNGPADTLWSFGGMTDQTLTGELAVGADFSGRVSNPQLTGIVRGERLTYQNQTYGTRLTDMVLSGRFAGNRLQVEQLTATAGAGKLAGRGSISLSSAQGYPMDMSFDLDNARIARSDTIASAATGKLRLTKVAGSTALLSGALALTDSRYELVRQGAAQVPDLTGVRFTPPRGRPRYTGNEPVSSPRGLLDGLRLDVALTAPNQVTVTGMGLDSEWSADLHVRGTNTAPQMSGEVNLVRGNLNFAGRRFDLQDGRIIFTGETPSNPIVRLSASDDIDGVTVSVNVTGRSLTPQITFTSNPGLPADEVLSRILFGNSVGQLSPLQAVQLAASLNSLRATGGGLNPMGKLRAATGLSRLSILSPDAATGRGTAISAGRYISNNVYLELITDARGFTATQIEVSLSRTLSILGAAGGSGLTNLNVRYRKRY